MPESDKAGSRLFQISFLLCLLTGLLVFVFVSVSGIVSSRFLDESVLGPWLWLLPVAITAQGLFMSFNFALNRYKKYQDIAIGKVSQNSTVAIVQVTGGLLGWGAGGLILGKTIGVAVSTLWLFLVALKKIPQIFIKEPFYSIKETAAEYYRYPKYNAPLAFLNSVSSNFPVILFITYFTDSIAGFYSMALRICSAPVQIISVAISQVVGKRLAEVHHENGDVRKYVIKILYYLIFIGLIPFGLLFIAGPPFFSFLLGPEWAEVGYYIRILTPYIYLNFVTQPLSYLPLLYNQQKRTLVIYSTSLILRILAIFVGIWMSAFYVSLILYSAVGIAISLYYIYWYLSICKKNTDN